MSAGADVRDAPPAIADRARWLAARLELLEAEKELTRRSDDLARRRRALPWVRIEKEYAFDSDAGVASLADLFGGRSQLLVYHFMFGPEYGGGCPSCSAIADGFNGFAVHLEHHDVAFVAVSSAPLVMLDEYRWRMGWTFRWVSAAHTDFNFDFNASFTEAQQRSGSVDYNYGPRDTTWLRDAGDHGRAAEHAAMAGTDTATYLREHPAMSAFAHRDGVVYHTYSAYARGLDALWGMYQWLDRAPGGRNDDGAWFRPRDRY
jgi:predicted dithiol-disulfide oxidoreductase (DUF899 family)